MQRRLITIIVPVYNVAAYIPQCLDSLLGQSYRRIEVICVDDGSTDESLEILERYAAEDSRVRVIRQKNGGAAVARNTALDVAKGDWIAFMDPDDFYPDSHTLEHMLEAAEREGVDVCGGSLRRLVDGVLESDASGMEPGYVFDSDGVVKYDDYQFDYGFWRFLYRRDFLEKNGLRFPAYRHQEDPPFMVHALALSGSFYALREPTYVYRRESGKKTVWDERRAWGFYSGIRDTINLCTRFGLVRLFDLELERLRSQWFLNAVGENLCHESVYRCVGDMVADIKGSSLYGKAKDNRLDSLLEAIGQARKADVIVSVIVPVYNVERYLARCLDSVLAQTLPWFEILCVDDGGTDGSAKILDDYARRDSRIKVLHKKNGGLSSARNFALPHVRGAYVMFIDSDDWIDENTLAESVRCMVRDVDIVCWGAKLMDEGVGPDDPVLIDGQKYHAIRFEGKKWCDAELIANTTVCVWNKLFKTEIVRKNNLDFAEGRIFEDNDFTYAYMSHCRSAWFIPEYYYFYSQRPGSIMQRFNKEGSPRVIDSIYVFDRLYRHLQRNDVVRKYQELLKSRFKSSMWIAVMRAPADIRMAHLETARRLVDDYEGEFGDWCRKGLREMRDKLRLEAMDATSVDIAPFLGLLHSFRLDLRYAQMERSLLRLETASRGLVVTAPTWMKGGGRDGVCITGEVGRGCVWFRAEGTGTVSVSLLGLDVRTREDGAMRLPIWVDYISVKVRGVEMVKGRISAWHDRPCCFTIDAKAGEVVEIAIATVPHVYERPTLKDILLKSKLPFLVNDGNVETILDNPMMQLFLPDARDAAIALQKSRIAADAEAIAALRNRQSELERVGSALKNRLQEEARTIAVLEGKLATEKKGVAETRKQLVDIGKRLAEAQRQRAAVEKKAQRRLNEVEALRHSQAYRTGMFVTFPARKTWGGIKCLRDNGVKYTAKHVVGKVARRMGVKSVKW